MNEYSTLHYSYMFYIASPWLKNQDGDLTLYNTKYFQEKTDLNCQNNNFYIISSILGNQNFS